MDKASKIFVSGHRGLVGGAVMRVLQAEGYTNLLLKTHGELDLCDQAGVNSFFDQERPEYVFLAAARVGGIHANNTYRADFIYDNLIVECNVIHACQVYGVKKLLFLGSSCIYPKHAAQPIHEKELLSGPLEETNEPYAVAKIAGIKLCESYNRQYGTDFISVMPTNLYGPGDNYHPQNSHVLPALIRRFHEAKWQGASSVTIWGTGTPRREFLYVDDLAQALIFLMNRYRGNDIINIGTGSDVSIRELAETIASAVGYSGTITFDTTKPDGTPRKLLDVGRINALGWKARTSLEQGIKKAYAWFIENEMTARK